MTKDWDVMQERVRQLSVVEKKPLHEVRELMRERFNFDAS